MPLKDLLKARFQSALQSIPAGTWKILITDDHIQSLLDIVYRPGEILQQNVTSVEPLQSPRTPQGVDAIYLLTPTSQNVSRIIADFEGRRTYKSAHLYFIDGIDDGLASRLTNSLPPDVLRAFVELYCDVLPVEERIFSINQPQAFFTMFGNAGGAASEDLALEAFEDDLKLTGRGVLNVLATLNENPYIRYYQPSHHSPLGPLANTGSSSSSAVAPPPQQNQASQSLRWRSAMGGASKVAEPTGDYLCKKIAVQVQNDLDEYMANNPEFPSASGRPKAVLLIVDRSMDPSAPLLHEFWYQAMVNDLLPVKDGQTYNYTYVNTVGGKESKVAELNDLDPVWVSVRHLHMKDAIDTIMTDFNKFAQENAGFSGNTTANVNDLKDMLASLPQFQTQREQFSLHLDMAQECMSLFEKKKLNVAAHVEQCCATGYTAEGKQPKSLVEEMVPLLDDRNITSLDKVRIIALYILFRDGVADEDRRRLYQHARLSISEQDTINNLIYLGVKVIKDAKDRNRGSRIKPPKSVQGEGEYELSRYQPIAQMVIEDQHRNRLDQNLFPYVKDAPEVAPTQRTASPFLSVNQAAPPASGSLRSARPTWHKAPSARSANTEGKQRIILFIAGGVTYSEMRLAYTVGQQLGKDVYIGSTHMLTPEKYCKDLRSLGRGGIGANPPTAHLEHPGAPGRPNRPPGRPTTYQAVIDRRYWTPPVGPPALAPPPGAPRPGPPPQTNSSFVNKMSDLSLGKDKDKDRDTISGSSSKKDGEKKEKKSLFKMKW